MAEVEDVLTEVEAVLSVYGDDCKIVGTYPPHLIVNLKPRTADVSSQQFVQATIGIKAGPRYPEEVPEITVIQSKGLDEQRQKKLTSSIQNKALELISCLMFVTLCEEAVEKLSSMNHPDGNCPLCLYSLVGEHVDGKSQPFMKLMSCFHCYHCHCIIQWLNWILLQNEKDVIDLSPPSKSHSSVRHKKSMHKMLEKRMGKCPVCREVFLAKDIEHILDLIETTIASDSYIDEIEGDVLQSESENHRRNKYEAVFKLQQENNGLIEPKKNEVLQPGMYLPESSSSEPTELVAESGSGSSVQNKDHVKPATNLSDSSINRPGSKMQSNSYSKNHRPRSSRKQQMRQWIEKN